MSRSSQGAPSLPATSPAQQRPPPIPLHFQHSPNSHSSSASTSATPSPSSNSAAMPVQPRRVSSMSADALPYHPYPVVTAASNGIGSASSSRPGSVSVSANHSSMDRSTPVYQSRRPSLIFEGDSMDGSYSFVISAPPSQPHSPTHRQPLSSMQQLAQALSSSPPPLLSQAQSLPVSSSTSAPPLPQFQPGAAQSRSSPRTSPIIYPNVATSTIPLDAPFPSLALSLSLPSSSSQDRDDAKTIEFYLKQAIAQKDSAAITSLLDKASNLALKLDPALIVSANQVLSDRMAENLHTAIFYLRQAIETKNRDAIKLILKQIDDSHRTSANSPSGYNASDLAVIDEARRLQFTLDKENAQTALFYLKQGVHLKNRDLLKQSLEKSLELPESLLDKELIATATNLLSELDQQHLIKYYLNSAIKQRNDIALESALEEAKKYRMGSDISEVNEATKLLVELRTKKGKHRDKAAKSASSQAKSAVAGRLFGAPLIDVVRRSDTPIPRLCTECIDWLSAQSLDEPGLFRVAGNKDSIEALKAQYEAQFADGRMVALTDSHDTAGLLKLYLRSLSEPLIPFDRYDVFIRHAQHCKENAKLDELKGLVQSLPMEHYALLATLSRFLSTVSKHSETNRMTADNLAIVFAPNLIRPAIETQNTMLYEMPLSIPLIAAMIVHASEVFSAPVQDAKSLYPASASYTHATMPAMSGGHPSAGGSGGASSANGGGSSGRKAVQSQTL